MHTYIYIYIYIYVCVYTNDVGEVSNSTSSSASCSKRTVRRNKYNKVDWTRWHLSRKWPCANVNAIRTLMKITVLTEGKLVSLKRSSKLRRLLHPDLTYKPPLNQAVISWVKLNLEQSHFFFIWLSRLNRQEGRRCSSVNCVGRTSFVYRWTIIELSTFELVSVDDVVKAVGSASSQQFASDPLPTRRRKIRLQLLYGSSQPCSTHL